MTNAERLAIVETKLGDIANDIKEIKDAILGLDNKYATKETENRVNRIYNWFIGGAVTGITAIIILLIELYSKLKGAK